MPRTDIEVLGVVALDAAIASPELFIRAGTLPDIVYDLTACAVFADLVVLVIVLVLRAFSALGTVEDWGVRRAGDTLLGV